MSTTPSELDKRPYKDSGVPGWLVRCPKRGDIAAMRCSEYQDRDGCGPRCHAKADDGALVALSAMRMVTPAPSVVIPKQADVSWLLDEEDDDVN